MPVRSQDKPDPCLSQTGEGADVCVGVGSSLNLNVHFHVIAMDGACAGQRDGNLLFHPLPAPSDEDIARMARAVCRKVTRHLGRLTGEDKDDQLTLDHLASASVQSRHVHAEAAAYCAWEAPARMPRPQS